MSGSTRNVLVAAFVAAVGTVGVSYAATGSFNPGKLVTEGTTAQGRSLAAGASAVTPTPDGSSDVTPTGTGGPERSEVGCGEFTGEDGKFNHGQFVRQSPKGGEARRAAAQSDCGKPVQATEEGDGDGAASDELEAPESGGAEAKVKNENDGRGHRGDGPGNSDFGNSPGNSDNRGQGQSKNGKK